MLNKLWPLVGQTPLIKISEKIYAKLETYSPTGSVKDRTIGYIVNKAIESGEIDKNTIICEATSGNTGIAISSIAASLGLQCNIYMPVNMSEERKQMMASFGAKIVNAPKDDFTGAIEMRDSFMSTNNNCWSPMQFSNPINIECHERTTAPEVFNDLKKINKNASAFIHGSGTGGTIEGFRRYINKNNYDTKVYMVQPSDSPHGIQGIADGKDFLSKQEDMDGIIYVDTNDAIERAKKFTKETGILVGISSGANIFASEKFISENTTEDAVVTILCDRGERYLSIY
jgi:cysteine synthase A